MNDQKLKEYLSLTNALLDSMQASVDRDSNGMWKFISYRTYMAKYNGLVLKVAQEVQPEPLLELLDVYDMKTIPDEFNSPGAEQQHLFEAVCTNLAILKSFLENRVNIRKDEIRNLRDFFHSNLRRAIFQPPKKEREVQDAVEQLLIGRGLTKGIDYDRETGRVKISIKESVPDFIFPKLDLALEIKLSKDITKAKEIVDEINADIRAYSTKYSKLLFLIYDLGSIRDEDEFKLGIENPQNIDLVVIKH